MSKVTSWRAQRPSGGGSWSLVADGIVPVETVRGRGLQVDLRQGEVAGFEWCTDWRSLWGGYGEISTSRRNPARDSGKGRIRQRLLRRGFWLESVISWRQRSRSIPSIGRLRPNTVSFSQGRAYLESRHSS